MQTKLENGKWVESILLVDSTGVPTTSGNPMTVTAGQVSSITATIGSGASVSGDIDLGLNRLGRIDMPAAWTAGDITFQVSNDNVVWNNLYDKDGVEYNVKTDASRSIIISVSDTMSIRYLRVRSGTSTTPVSQAASRIITLVLVP